MVVVRRLQPEGEPDPYETPEPAPVQDGVVRRRDVVRQAQPEPEEEDEREPAPERSRSSEEAPHRGGEDSSPIRSGWHGFNEIKQRGAKWAERLTISNKPELVKFLEDEPFAEFRQHWVNKRPYICLETDCPLCGAADVPQPVVAFNILHCSTGGDPVNKTLQLGIRATNQLQEMAAAPGVGGSLVKDYWAVSKSGTKQQTAWNFRPVKARDLNDDWKFDPPLTDGEIAAATERKYDVSVFEVPTRKTMRDLVSQIMDEE